MRERLHWACRILAVAVAAITATTGQAQAGELGHYFPAIMNIRDFVVPDPGFYGVVYGAFYASDRINDRSGDKVRSITNDRGVTFDVDTDLDLFVLAPTLIWVSDWEVFGARHAAFISPSFGSTSLGAGLSTQTGRGVSVDDGASAINCNAYAA